jgi:hypothetical protein
LAVQRLTSRRGKGACSFARHFCRSSELLGPQEIDFSFTDPSSFEDMESGDQIPIVPTKLAADYRVLVKAHIEALAKKAAQQPVDYMLLNTTMPLDFALFRFLSMRQRLARMR